MGNERGGIEARLMAGEVALLEWCKSIVSADDRPRNVAIELIPYLKSPDCAENIWLGRILSARADVPRDLRVLANKLVSQALAGISVVAMLIDADVIDSPYGEKPALTPEDLAAAEARRSKLEAAERRVRKSIGDTLGLLSEGDLDVASDCVAQLIERETAADDGCPHCVRSLAIAGAAIEDIKGRRRAAAESN